MSGRIPHVLLLEIEVAEERHEELLEFLRSAKNLYERPGGIRVRLLQALDDPCRLIEVIEYDDEAAFEADQRRVAEDPEMIETLTTWRGLLVGEVRVRPFRELTASLTKGDSK